MSEDKYFWRDARGDLSIDLKDMSAHSIGPHDGITDEEVDNYSEYLKVGFMKLINWVNRHEGETFYHLPHNSLMIRDILSRCEGLRQGFDNIFILGIGGSALGASAVYHALKANSGLKTLLMADNVDPDFFAGLLERIRIKDTIFLVISKSGKTLETLSQLSVVMDRLKKIEEKPHEHLVIITDPEQGPLRRFADDLEITSFPVPPLVGGRFSVLSPVGLVPLHLAGIDINELLAGAGEMAMSCGEDDLHKNPALLTASLIYLSYIRKGKDITVFMPYANALLNLCMWFRQLWAESLGKKQDTQSNIVHRGLTPVVALGTTDQHSQLQLYMEGPRDKMMVFLRVEEFRNRVDIPSLDNHFLSMDFMSGKSLCELILASQAATRQSLKEASRPSITVSVPRITAFHIGQLLFLLEMVTAIMGFMMNLNPFDQPGVERGKTLTKEILGSK